MVKNSSIEILGLTNVHAHIIAQLFETGQITVAVNKEIAKINNSDRGGEQDIPLIESPRTNYGVSKDHKHIIVTF